MNEEQSWGRQVKTDKLFCVASLTCWTMGEKQKKEKKKRLIHIDLHCLLLPNVIHEMQCAVSKCFSLKKNKKIY